MNGNAGHVHFAVQMIDNDIAGFILMQSGAQLGLMNDALSQVFNHPCPRIVANGFGPQLRQVVGPDVGCRGGDIDGPLAKRIYCLPFQDSRGFASFDPDIVKA